MNKRRTLIALREILSTRLSEEELRSLCFDLGVDYENLGGESKAAHARRLIEHFERRERLEELLAGCKSSLPGIPWDNLLATDTAGSPETIPTTQPSLGRVKILFLAANPADTPPLRLDQEVRAMDEALRQSEYRQRFEIVQQWAVRVSDLQACLLRHKPQIVHFSGHGSPSSEIVLENAQGASQVVPAQALRGLFALLKDNIRCVVLNACYSREQAQGLAAYIDCVIGMSKAIGDSASLNFTAAFYQALGYGRDIQTAFDLGCLQVDLLGLGDADAPALLALRQEARTIKLL